MIVMDEETGQVQQQTEIVPQDVLQQQPGFSLVDYIKEHPEAISGIFSSYQDSVEEMLDSAGMARPLVESSIKERCPWLWDAVYGKPAGSIEPPVTRRRRTTQEEDDYDDEDNYVPDRQILDEARQLAISMHLSGMSWSDISDQIYRKYDLDWHPNKTKDIVLKSLAWQERPRRNSSQVASGGMNLANLDENSKKKVNELITEINQLRSENDKNKKVGLIRKIWKAIY